MGLPFDILDRKLEFAREFGATHTVNASTGDPVSRVRSLTGGLGVAPLTAEVSVPVMSLVFEERVLTGSIYGSSRPRHDIPVLFDLYRAGKLKLDQLLTRTYPLERINEAYEALERGEVARSVLTF